MDLSEIEIRQDEAECYTDWLTKHDPHDYMAYHHARGAVLDALRPGEQQMTKAKTLARAVDLAVERGYNGGVPATSVGSDVVVFGHTRYSMYEILFSHPFAKALFGEQWAHQLQQMVIAPDIYKYLETNLPEAD